MNKLFSTNPVLPKGGLTVIRIIIGCFLIYHGWEVFDKNKMNEYIAWDVFKNSSSPSFMVYLGKTAELVAGFLLAIGFVHPDSFHYNYRYIYLHSFFVGNGKFGTKTSIHSCLHCLDASSFLQVPGNGALIIYYLIKIKL